MQKPCRSCLDLISNLTVSARRTYGKPENLQPFSSWSQVAEWNALCIPSLVDQKVGLYETYAPGAAVAMVIVRMTKDKTNIGLNCAKIFSGRP